MSARRRRSRSRSEADDAEFELSADGATFRPPFISPRDSARWAVGLLLVTVALAWLAVGIDLSNLNLVFKATHGTAIPEDLRRAQFTAESWLSWFQLFILGVTATAFITWLYQTRANLRALGVRRPTFRREWCILGFLAPGVNFFRPYQVMREIWQASDPESLDAFQWRVRPPPRLLALWWGSVIVAVVLRLLALLTDLGAGLSLQRLELSLGLLTLADVSTGVSAGLACFVVNRLSDTQEEKHARLLDAESAASL